MMENFFPDIISLPAAGAALISGKDAEQMSPSTHQADNEIQEPDSCTCKQQESVTIICSVSNTGLLG